MKTNVFFIAILVAFGLMVFIACEKDTVTKDDSDAENTALANQFFEYSPSKNKSVGRNDREDFTVHSINVLKKYNETVNFVPDFIENIGFAHWENARFFHLENQIVLQIPVYDAADTVVQALIIMAETPCADSCAYYVIRRNYFDKFVNNEAPKLTLRKVIDLFILADFKVFGKSSYLPNGRIRYANNDSRNKSFAVIEKIICYVTEGYVDGELVSSRWECETSYSYLHVIDDGYNSGGGGGSHNDSFDGFSGGGGSVYTPPSDMETIKETFCQSFNGILNMSTVKRNLNKLTIHQEQFIISLANLAAFSELGLLTDNLRSDLVNYSTSNSLYSKYNKLNNAKKYIVGWQQVKNSSPNSNKAYLSPEINDTNFQIKFYPEKNGEKNAVGLVKEGVWDHGVEAALELLERFFIDKVGQKDDFLADMHLSNAVNFMEDYCDD